MLLDTLGIEETLLEALLGETVNEGRLDLPKEVLTCEVLKVEATIGLDFLEEPYKLIGTIGFKLEPFEVRKSAITRTLGLVEANLT
jgi:hypothetical protein